jgi:hypothetical protein
VVVVLDFEKISTQTSPNKTDCHDITEILLKVALNTIALSKIKFSPNPKNVCVE